MLDQLISRLRQGQALSAALQQTPDAFPALYVAAMRAAERTGDLPEALSRPMDQHTDRVHADRHMLGDLLVTPVFQASERKRFGLVGRKLFEGQAQLIG